MLEKSQPFVSVIIPVFNDVERLKLCLNALENQTYYRDLYEVIVVDNGSDEPIEHTLTPFTQVQAIQETKPGSYAARNRGILLARGDVLAFTDADCIPDLDWIENGVTNLLSLPNCGLIAGKIRVFAQNPVCPPTMVELYESVMAFPQETYIRKWHFGVTANLFTFKDVTEKVGSFNPKLNSGGDLEWGQRVSSHGYKLVYADNVCVAHPARRSLREIYKKSVRVVGGLHTLYPSTRPTLLRFAKYFLLGLLPPVRETAKILSDARLKGFKQKVQVAFVLFFVEYSKAVERLRLILGGSPRRV